MRAVIRQGRRLGGDEMAAPTPEPGQVLCRTLACGICGSDLHALDHYDHMIEMTERLGGFSHMKQGRRHRVRPRVLLRGAGRRPGRRRFKPGTRVVSMPVLIAPAGFETVGYSSRIPGGFAEQILLVRDAAACEVPNGLSAEHAALTEPLAVGEHAVAKAEPAADHVFMVVGCGPVGLAVIASLKARGLGPIVACDFSPERRAAAERMGADTLVDPATVSPHASWTEFGVPATPRRGPDRRRPGPGGEDAADLRVRRRARRDPGPGPGRAGGNAGSSSPACACRPTPSSPWPSSPRRSSCASCWATRPRSSPRRCATSPKAERATPTIITGVVTLDETPAAFIRLQTDKSQIKIMVKPGA